MHLNKSELGKIGEDLAASYLQDLGYEILMRNWRFQRVELDIVALDKSTLVFCEVKTRSSLRHGMPSEAITPLKIQHIRTAALHWLGNHPARHQGMRFDAISIIYCDGNPAKISHLKGIA